MIIYRQYDVLIKYKVEINPIFMYDYLVIQIQYQGRIKMNPSQSKLKVEVEAMKHLLKVFPGLSIPSNTKSDSLLSLLEEAVKHLAVPAFGELFHTIKNMKDAVDAQELKIQRRMIEIDEETLDGISEPNFTKHPSVSTEECFEEEPSHDCNVSDVWNWDVKQDLMNSMSSNKSYLDFMD